MRHDTHTFACAVGEAMLAALAALEEHGVPLPPEGPARIEMMERVHDDLWAVVDRLPQGD